MPDTLLPTTELEAVNDLLSVIMELPIASLDETEGDAQLALRLLRQESKAVQAEGWHWNTDENLKLLPDINGEIAVPSGTLKIDTTGLSAGLDLSQRNGKLYGRRQFSNDAATFNIASLSSGGVYVDIVQLYDFEELPENARQYIRVRAGRKFLQRTLGGQDRIGFEANDEKIARAVLESEEESDADRSILDNADYARLYIGRRDNLPWL